MPISNAFNKPLIVHVLHISKSMYLQALSRRKTYTQHLSNRTPWTFLSKVPLAKMHCARIASEHREMINMPMEVFGALTIRNGCCGRVQDRMLWCWEVLEKAVLAAVSV